MLLFLQYSLTLEDADQHYDDQGGYADADEDVYVFQRNLAEFLVEILKGIHLAAVGAVGFLFGLGSSLFFAHRLLLRQVLAQVKGNGDDDDKALCNVGVGGVDAEELQANLQDFKDQNTDQNAGDLADAAVGGNAADGAGCDGVQPLPVLVEAPPAFAPTRKPPRAYMQEARM